MSFIEGDYVETGEGLILAVRGAIHPPGKVIAYPRYLRIGRRVEGLHSLPASLGVLYSRFPQYVFFDKQFMQNLSMVPVDRIARAYSAKGYLKRPPRTGSSLDSKARTMAREIAKRMGTGVDCIGVSGSLLLGFEHSASDLDLLVYGRRNSRRAYRALRSMRSEGLAKAISEAEAFSLMKHRSDSALGVEEWIEHETRKLLDGSFLGTSYSIKLVPLYARASTLYRGTRHLPMGMATLTGRVEDDSEAIYTPCNYAVSDVKVLKGAPHASQVREVTSYRSRFCEQARRGERIRATGRVEKVLRSGKGETWRVVVGGFQGDVLTLEKT